MSDSVTKTRAPFPENVPMAGTQLEEIRLEIKRLQARESALVDYIIGKMPVEVDENGKGTAVMGRVRRSVWTKVSISHAKILDALLDRGIIPRTREQAVLDVKEEFTNRTQQNKVTIEEDLEEPR